MDLDPRSQHILQVIVESYVAHMQPVSSNTVAGLLEDMHLSSATVRSKMAELEACGLLHQPHTSAGRVPTEKAFRIYLDGLLSPKLRRRDRTRLDAAFEHVHWPDFPTNLGQTLANLSGQMAVVAMSRTLDSGVKEVGLLRYDKKRFVVVFVCSNGMLRQKVMTVDFDVEATDLLAAQNFINEQLACCSIGELRQRIEQELEGVRRRFVSLQRNALEIGAHAIKGAQKGPRLDLFVEGANHLVGQPEFSDMHELQAMLRAVEERTALLELLTLILDSGGVKVVLGSEHRVTALSHITCVGSAACVNVGTSAAVTLMGPARMDYGRLVPLVEYATHRFEHCF